MGFFGGGLSLDEVQRIVSAATKPLSERVRKLEEELSSAQSEVSRLKGSLSAESGLMPIPKDLAQQALVELVAKVNSKEFLDRLYAQLGTNLETIVKQVVIQLQEVDDDIDLSDYDPPSKEEVLSALVESLSEDTWENVDMDEVHRALGQALVGNIVLELKKDEDSDDDGADESEGG